MAYGKHPNPQWYCLKTLPAAKGKTALMIRLRGDLERGRAARETSARSRQISKAEPEPCSGESGTLTFEMGTLWWGILRTLEAQTPLKL